MKPTDPLDDRSPLSEGIAWSSTIVSIALEMVLPGLLGHWIDRKLGTVMVFLVAGLILGVVAGWFTWFARQTPDKAKDAAFRGGTIGRSCVTMNHWITKLRRRELLAQSVALATVTVLAWGLLAPMATLVSGRSAWMAASAAAAIAWLGAQLALVVCHPVRGPNHVGRVVLLGMIPRMGVPLLCLIAMLLISRAGQLGSPGALYYVVVLLVIFYQVTLATEIILVWLGRTTSG